MLRVLRTKLRYFFLLLHFLSTASWITQSDFVGVSGLSVPYEHGFWGSSFPRPGCIHLNSNVYLHWALVMVGMPFIFLLPII